MTITPTARAVAHPRIHARQCACCGRAVPRSEPMGSAAFEPAGPATRLTFSVCRQCQPCLPDDLPALARLHAALMRRCPALMLAPLQAALRLQDAQGGGETLPPFTPAWSAAR